MKVRRVIYGPRAVDDFERIFNWLSATASPEAALRVIERLEEKLSALDVASERGIARDDLAAGLRIVALGDRAVAAVRVREADLLIARVFYGGENWEATIVREGLD